MSKNKKKQRDLTRIGVRTLKSKDSRSKFRRWGFRANLTLENGDQRVFKLPGFAYGDQQIARETASRLEDQFLGGDGPKPEKVEIILVPFETVSIETYHQLIGQNDQISLMSRTAFVLAERLRIGLNDERDVATIVSSAVEVAREELFPKLKEAKAKMAALAAGGDVELVSEAELDELAHTAQTGGEVILTNEEAA